MQPIDRPSKIPGVTPVIPLRLPGQQDLREARFLESLASLLGAGLLPLVAFEQPSLSVLLGGHSIADARRELQAGKPLATAIERLGFDRLACARIAAAESAGRVPAALRRLAAERTRRAQALAQAVGRMLYPLFVLHFAAFAAHLPQILAGTKSAGWLGMLTWVLPIDAILLVSLFLVRDSIRGGASGSFLARLPWIGAMLRDLALGRVFRALSDLYGSGLPLSKALALAAGGVGHPFREALEGASRRLESGSAFTAELQRSGVVDATSLALLAPAEISGTLSEGLEQAARLREESAARAVHWSTVGPGTILYALAVGSVVFAAYRVYLAPLQSALSQLPG